MGIIEKIKKFCFKFLWSGNNDSSGAPWASWKTLACLKFLGGWGLKIRAVFAKALAAKSVWNVIQGSGLWVQIVVPKYVYPFSLLEWIRSSVKHKRSMSICWKVVLWSFDIIGNNLVSKIGNGVDVHLGMDPWVGYKWRHLLPYPLVDKLHSVGVFSLKYIGAPGLTVLMEQGWLSADHLGLTDQLDVTIWNGYLSTLKAKSCEIIQ